MKSISKRENEIIHQIRDRDMIIFGMKDVCRFLSISNNNASRIIKSMKKKDLIRTIERGKFILSDSYNDLDIYEIASDIYHPSYISFWSALHVHSMTDQVPRRVFLATTRRKRPMKLQGQILQYVTIKKEMFFGYETIGRMVVSDPEKTIIDCLRHPEYSGGIDHIKGSLNEDLDIGKLIEYCRMTRSTTIASRLGFLLEKKDIDFDEDILLSMITTYSKLDPGRERTGPNGKWKLYENRDVP